MPFIVHRAVSRTCPSYAQTIRTAMLHKGRVAVKAGRDDTTAGRDDTSRTHERPNMPRHPSYERTHKMAFDVHREARRATLRSTASWTQGAGVAAPRECPPGSCDGALLHSMPRSQGETCETSQQCELPTQCAIESLPGASAPRLGDGHPPRPSGTGAFAQRCVECAPAPGAHWSWQAGDSPACSRADASRGDHAGPQPCAALHAEKPLGQM